MWRRRIRKYSSSDSEDECVSNKPYDNAVVVVPPPPPPPIGPPALVGSDGGSVTLVGPLEFQNATGTTFWGLLGTFRASVLPVSVISNVTEQIFFDAAFIEPINNNYTLRLPSYLWLHSELNVVLENGFQFVVAGRRPSIGDIPTFPWGVSASVKVYLFVRCDAGMGVGTISVTQNGSNVSKTEVVSNPNDHLMVFDFDAVVTGEATGTNPVMIVGTRFTIGIAGGRTFSLVGYVSSVLKGHRFSSTRSISLPALNGLPLGSGNAPQETTVYSQIPWNLTRYGSESLTNAQRYLFCEFQGSRGDGGGFPMRSIVIGSKWYSANTATSTSAQINQVVGSRKWVIHSSSVDPARNGLTFGCYMVFNIQLAQPRCCNVFTHMYISS